MGGKEFHNTIYASSSPSSFLERKEEYKNQLIKSIELLSENSKGVFLVLSPMIAGWDTVKLLTVLSKKDKSLQEIKKLLEINRETIYDRTSEIDSILLDVPNSLPNVYVIDRKNYSCNSVICSPLSQDLNLLLIDSNHPSEYLSNLIFNDVLKKLNEISPSNTDA